MRHDEDGKKYLYDLLAIKKKPAARLSHKTERSKLHFVVARRWRDSVVTL